DEWVMWLDDLSLGRPSASGISPEAGDDHTGLAGSPVGVDASESFDSDGTLTSYEWDFDGDGATDRTGETAEYTYGSAGERTVTLTVTDDDGNTAQDTLDINVVTGFQEDFSDLGEWTIENSAFQPTTSPVLNGSYSAGMEKGSAGQQVARTTAFAGGARPDVLKFHFYEEGSSNGGGVRLQNSNGNYEVGLATDNPGWAVSDGDGTDRVDSGDGYGRWVEVRAEFDWAGGTYTYRFEDLQSGRVATGTRSLRHGEDVETVHIENYNGGSWDGDEWVMWLDDLSLGSGN
ncbi:hypothetical protein BRD17_03540, partial [Halobacteriales archaeon SW_7_68_16]